MGLFEDIFRYASNIIGFTVYSLLLNVYLIFRKVVLMIINRGKERKFEQSCHVQTIWWKRKFFTIDVAAPTDFFAVHNERVHPKYVLQRIVSIYCTTKNYVYFIETDVTTDVFKSETNPFQYIGQFNHAKKLISMPVQAFIRFCESLRYQEENVLFMPNTGRCGSTLLSQALEKIPGTRLHAEPDSLTNLASLWRSAALNQEQYEQVLAAIFAYLCRPMAGVSRICIKTRSCASCHVEAIRKHFPKTKFVFGYRNNLNTVSSFLGLMVSETVQSLAMYLIDSDRFSAIVPFFRKRMYQYFCFGLDEHYLSLRPESLNTVEHFTYAWGNCISLIMRFRDNGGKCIPIRYEDLIADTKGVLSDVFKEVKIDEKHIDLALEAFKNDSQEGTPLDKSNINNAARRRIMDTDIIRANKILKMFNLPTLGSPFTLENMQ